MKQVPPSEAGLHCSIQNYTGQLKSCVVTNDRGGGCGGQPRETGTRAPQTTEMGFFCFDNAQANCCRATLKCCSCAVGWICAAYAAILSLSEVGQRNSAPSENFSMNYCQSPP